MCSHQRRAFSRNVMLPNRWNAVQRVRGEVGIGRSAPTSCRQKEMKVRAHFVRKWLKQFYQHFDRSLRGSWDREVRPDEMSSKRDEIWVDFVRFLWKVIEKVSGQRFDRSSRGSWDREVRPDEMSSKRDAAMGRLWVISFESVWGSFLSAF